MKDLTTVYSTDCFKVIKMILYVLFHVESTSVSSFFALSFLQSFLDIFLSRS